jgi:AraC-like DNA-binding protein
MKVKVHTLDRGQSELVFEGSFPDGFEGITEGRARGIAEKISTIPLSVGSFHAKETWFHGIHLSNAEITLNRPIGVHVESDSPVVEMHFCLGGQSGITYSDTPGMPDIFSPLQHNIMYTPGFNGTFHITPQTTGQRFFEVHLTETYFRELVQDECRVLSNLVGKMDRKEMASASKHNLGITTQMQRIIGDMISCQRKGSLQRIYLESKVLELLMLQAEQFEDSLNGTKRPSLKATDIDRIHHAKMLIEQDLNAPCSLAALARQVGLNDFKLKKGFKEVYGTTVFGYLHDLRMEQARRMLLDEHKTVGEAADSAGYRNAHHFTVAFKKYFGHLPSELKHISKLKTSGMPL